MKFRCRHCGKVLVRDMRSKVYRESLTKRGYKTYCDVKHRDTFAVRIK